MPSLHFSFVFFGGMTLAVPFGLIELLEESCPVPLSAYRTIHSRLSHPRSTHPQGRSCMSAPSLARFHYRTYHRILGLPNLLLYLYAQCLANRRRQITVEWTSEYQRQAESFQTQCWLKIETRKCQGLNARRWGLRSNKNDPEHHRILLKGSPIPLPHVAWWPKAPFPAPWLNALPFLGTGQAGIPDKPLWLVRDDFIVRAHPGFSPPRNTSHRTRLPSLPHGCAPPAGWSKTNRHSPGRFLSSSAPSLPDSASKKGVYNRQWGPSRLVSQSAANPLQFRVGLGLHTYNWPARWLLYGASFTRGLEVKNRGAWSS